MQPRLPSPRKVSIEKPYVATSRSLKLQSWREDDTEFDVNANANDDANANVDLDGVEEEECLFSIFFDSITTREK